MGLRETQLHTFRPLCVNHLTINESAALKAMHGRKKHTIFGAISCTDCEKVFIYRLDVKQVKEKTSFGTIIALLYKMAKLAVSLSAGSKSSTGATLEKVWRQL